MENNRKLPEIEIHGTVFQFDINKVTLIEKNDPDNEISFAFMEDKGTGYSFEYSTFCKNHHFFMKDPNLEELLDKFLGPDLDPPIFVEIPRLTEIDPQGFSEKYKCTTKDMVEKTDFELMVDQDVFNKRIDGHPVRVNISENQYEVDPVNDILWSLDGKEDIELKKFSDYFDKDTLNYHIFYDADAGKAVDIYKNGFEGSEAVRLVQIPDVLFLDPVGKHHSLKLPPTFGLMYIDLKLEHDLQMSSREITQIIPAERNESGQIEMLIEGTTFIVDVNTFEFRDKANPENFIPLEMLEDSDNGYKIEYKGREIQLPDFVVLDPEGMAKKYNVTVEEVQKHDDFHFMVDQEAFNLRVQGKLPTLEIDGHTFTVDIRMNMLRSATDFNSKGINFDDIDHYFSEEKDAYIIPYDPKKREFRELDYDNLFSIPTDLIAVEFPFQTKLDPIGWNRMGGYNIKDDLKLIGVKSHFVAEVIPWEQTYIVDIIRDNKEERQIKEDNQQKNNADQKKGRKM